MQSAPLHLVIHSQVKPNVASRVPGIVHITSRKTVNTTWLSKPRKLKKKGGMDSRALMLLIDLANACPVHFRPATARQSVRGGTAEAIAAATGLKVFQHQCSWTAPPQQDRNLPSTHSPPAEHRQAERSNRSCARPMSELEPSEAAADRDRKTRSVYLQRDAARSAFYIAVLVHIFTSRSGPAVRA
ncbi:hypothetical protein AOLI_G00278640 [Acnodon oligacanthus]